MFPFSNIAVGMNANVDLLCFRAIRFCQCRPVLANSKAVTIFVQTAKLQKRKVRTTKKTRAWKWERASNTFFFNFREQFEKNHDPSNPSWVPEPKQFHSARGQLRLRSQTLNTLEHWNRNGDTRSRATKGLAFSGNVGCSYEPSWTCLGFTNHLVEEDESSGRRGWIVGMKTFRIHSYADWWTTSTPLKVCWRFPKFVVQFLGHVRWVLFVSIKTKIKTVSWESLGPNSRIWGLRLSGNVSKFWQTWTSRLMGVCWSNMELAYSRIDQDFYCDPCGSAKIV